MMNSELVAIKGGKDGLRLQVHEHAEWPAVLDALRARLSQGGAFLSGATVVLDLGSRAVSEEELASMTQLLREHGVQLESVFSLTKEGRQAARAAGLPSRAMARPTQELLAPGEGALCIRRTIRSGQQIRHPGDVTVIGDLNAGGEIIAGGSVVVWGRVRGVIHAGAMGDTSAVICALSLTPTQLRIADLIARSPDVGAERRPEIAHIADGQILVETWQAFRR